MATATTTAPITVSRPIGVLVVVPFTIRFLSARV